MILDTQVRQTSKLVTVPRDRTKQPHLVGMEEYTYSRQQAKLDSLNNTLRLVGYHI